ncbi:methyl-accepting chemotaxis protein [Aliikangiella marina]|uniref:Methyl-accepting chemotaxis protein n=1 Tax=Aliikangiella marina TaxID=1712262 RepID=A0A545T6D4_9GAMM|nr:methyl-accepting chemotaxis protein [Aliikangiella marina]TQV72784.1 methyl-accepting chemotaxis protein [Aliikangiella marina]
MGMLVSYLSRHMTGLILFPCILLAAIVSYDSMNAYSTMKQAEHDKTDAIASYEVLALVHELQKERGYSAGFLGSEGGQLGLELRQQRRATDSALDIVVNSQSRKRVGSQFGNKVEAMLTELKNINSVRSRVDTLNIELSNALGYYTRINSLGIELVNIAGKLSEDPKVIDYLFAIAALSLVKESAGIERAVLANVLGANNFPDNLRRRHIGLLVKQEVFLEEAMQLAPEETLKKWRDLMRANEFKQVEDIRNKVSSLNSDFGISAAQWFQVATTRIDILRKGEEQGLQTALALAEQNRSKAFTILVVELITLFVGLAVTFLVVAMIRRRNEQSLLIAKGIREVIDNRDLADEIPVLLSDEIGQSAENINLMTRRFSKDLHDIQEGSQKISVATDETHAAIQNNFENIAKQNTRVEMIAAAVEQMSANIQVIAQAIADNAEAAKEVSQQSNTGNNVVVNAVSGMENVARMMEESVESITQLQERVNGISEIVIMIQSIAEQTNLLALNAAIEAARAGEQGRGFAVVADEVRSLASRTQECTVQISTLVEELQHSSTSTSATINDAKEQASSASESTASVQAALQAIVAVAENVEETTDSVSINIQEQCTALEEVNQNVVDIHNKSIEGMTAAQQISIASENISQNVRNTDQLIQQYKTE